MEGSLSVLNARTIEHIPTISRCANTKPAAYATGKINGFGTNMLLDSGVSCSVIYSEYVLLMCSMTLTNTDGTELLLIGTTAVPVILNGLNTSHTGPSFLWNISQPLLSFLR